MNRQLEVIVTSREEAVEAARGGADRLELLRDIESGGFSPAPQILTEVLQAVKIPVRAMVRTSTEHDAVSPAELDVLAAQARTFREVGAAGLVMGFVRHGAVDLHPLRRICAGLEGLPVTFHRAFEEVSDRSKALADIRSIAAVDRILVRLGPRFRPEEVSALHATSAPRLQFIVGMGLDLSLLPAIRGLAPEVAVHVGRAVREGETTSGVLLREKVAALKSALR